MPRTMSREECENFLADVHVGVLSVADGDRGPLSSPVWYCYEPGGTLIFSTRKETRKGALLSVGTRVSFVVQNEGDMLAGDLPRYVSVEGPVVKLEDADIVRDLRPIVKRYLGEEVGYGYLEATRGESADDEWIVHVQPDRWLSRDFA